MLDFLLYANLLLVLVALGMEAYALRSPAYRFERAVGVIGLALITWSYITVIFNLSAGMPTVILRPGILLLLAYIVSRDIYEFFHR